jgi:delta 1-pyrroline-5-carboxylate dehydrogenase
VVGQQPFGEARGSGTNDKAGSILNLQRWVSPRTIKETFVPATDYRYSFMTASANARPTVAAATYVQLMRARFVLGAHAAQAGPPTATVFSKHRLPTNNQADPRFDEPGS